MFDEDSTPDLSTLKDELERESDFLQSNSVTGLNTRDGAIYPVPPALTTAIENHNVSQGDICAGHDYLNEFTYSS